MFQGVGVFFVGWTKELGLQDTLVRVGRNFREFIFNLDNCHDHFKEGFPNMKAPSFFVQEENEKGE